MAGSGAVAKSGGSCSNGRHRGLGNAGHGREIGGKTTYRSGIDFYTFRVHVFKLYNLLME